MAETFVEAAFVAFCTPPDFTVSVDAVVVAELAVELEVVLCMTVGVLFPITPPPPPPTVAAADLVVEVATRAGEDEERDTDSSTASLHRVHNHKRRRQTRERERDRKSQRRAEEHHT
jgi:hypothetical protein